MLNDVTIRIAHVEGKLEYLEREQHSLGPAAGVILSEEEEENARRLAWEIDVLKDDIYDDVVFRSIAQRKLFGYIAGLFIFLPMSMIGIGWGLRIALK